MEHQEFFVADKAYRMWGADQAGRNRRFLKAIDPDHYRYIAAVHRGHLDHDQHAQRAAIALRTALHHGTETFLSLIGAALQAPMCMYGWMLRSRTEDVRDVVERINGEQPMPGARGHTRWSWGSVAAEVLSPIPDAEPRKDVIRDGFARWWSELAHLYVSDKATAEYNSIKHGGRAKSGGSTLHVGAEHQFGIPPPEAEMKILLASGFGTSFMELVKVDGKKTDFQVADTSLHWNAHDLPKMLDLLATSIHNVISYLMLVNGDESAQVLVLTDESVAVLDSIRIAMIPSFSFKEKVLVK